MYGKPLVWRSSLPATVPQAPTIASQGLTRTAGSGSIGRAPSFSSPDEAVVHAPEAPDLRVAQIEVGEQPPKAIDRSRIGGCSIRLNQPTNCVSQPPRDAVGQQEIDVFLLEDALQSADRTVMVPLTPPRYNRDSMEWAHDRDWRSTALAAPRSRRR